MLPKQIEGVTLDTRTLEKITKELKPRATRIVKAYGNMMLASAVKRAPVDTGALINSMTANSKMVEELTYRLQDGVEYGVFQELGTSKMSARPFMRPAIEELRQKFLDAFKGLFKT
jgi:HK97 gp10 family phage protein